MIQGLKLNSKWKWVAKDIHGVWYFYNKEPKRYETYWLSPGTALDLFNAFDTSGLPNCDWKDSLHQIVDGKLVKYVNLKKDDPVMVFDSDFNKWRPRHFSRSSDNGTILCFYEGKSSWTSFGIETEWEKWRLPTKEELG